MLFALNGLLLRLPPTSFSAAAGLAGPAFELKPLFPVAPPARALGIAAEPRQWYAAQLKESTAGANPWDVAHEAVARAPDVIEPNLVQPWIQDGSRTHARFLPDIACTSATMDTSWAWVRVHGSSMVFLPLVPRLTGAQRT